MLSQWILQHEYVTRTAWVSLDEGDNDLERFVAYLVAGLGSVDDAVGRQTEALLQSQQPKSFEILLTPLLNDIATLSKPLILVLDDYHVIHDLHVHDAMNFILKHKPLAFHIVIATRYDPPLPLGQLRARGQLNEIRSADLGFSHDETASFFVSVVGTKLDTQEIEMLEQRTEGWVAGLQLAGLALQGHEDGSEFITQFSGDHTYIVDYLGGEVFRHQSDEVRDFLLNTSILSRLSLELCNAVVGSQNAKELLDYLRQSNLFLIPLDNRRKWYRYHHLFSDLLLHFLQQESPEQIPELHKRASNWYMDQGFVDDAVFHALEGKHYSEAADIIEAIAQSLIGQSRLDTVFKWIEALPNELMLQRPYLPLYQAWALNFSQNPPDIEPYLQKAENVQQETGQKKDDLIGQILLLRGYRISRQGNPAEGIPLLQKALNHLAQSSVMPRSVANLSLGLANWMQALFSNAEMYLEQAVSDIHLSIHGTEFPLGTAAGFLIDSYIQRGKLIKAESLANAITNNSFFYTKDRPLTVLGYAYARLGKILYERNQLEDAVELLVACINMAEWIGDIELLVGSTTTLIIVEFRLGNHNEAKHLLDGVLNTIDRGRVPENAKIIHKERLMRIFPQQGVSAGWEESIQQAVHEKQAWHPIGTLALARLHLHRKQAGKAQNLLEYALNISQEIGAIDWVIRGLILQSLVFRLQQQPDVSLHTLAHALSLAESEVYIRTFVDEGAVLGELLTELIKNCDDFQQVFKFSTEYVTRLLSIITQENQQTTPLYEELTNRELTVLRLVASGLSNQDIADELVITLGAIKKHNQRIYRKLDVSNRTQAIKRAQELHLL